MEHLLFQSADYHARANRLSARLHTELLDASPFLQTTKIGFFLHDARDIGVFIDCQRDNGSLGMKTEDLPCRERLNIFIDLYNNLLAAA